MSDKTHTAASSFYEVLDISKTATESEIKKAYRKKALQWHPDRALARNVDKDVATEQFKLVASAFDTLSDPQKRADYDRWGHNSDSGGGSGGNPFRGGGGGGSHGFHGNVDADEIFKAFFGQGFGGVPMGGGGGVQFRSFSFGGGSMGSMGMSGGGGDLNEIFQRIHQQQQQQTGQRAGASGGGGRGNAIFNNQASGGSFQQSPQVFSLDCMFFVRLVFFCWLMNFLFLS